jgi:ADP-dependent phosphofructokinase/glucokinase
MRLIMIRKLIVLITFGSLTRVQIRQKLLKNIKITSYCINIMESELVKIHNTLNFTDRRQLTAEIPRTINGCKTH